jgi:HAAS
MTPGTLHPLAEDYLRRLRRDGRRLPPERLSELMAEIEGHLGEAIPPGAADREALEVLGRLGSPGDIVEAERPPAHGPAGRRSWREWAAVILLPLGGFAFGVGWLVGLVLLWSSRLWTTREKLIGTLIVPGGIATALLVVVLTGTKRRCSGFATVNPSTGAQVGRSTMHCTPSAGPSAATTAWQIALVVLCVLGPVVSAVYLARRARDRSVFMGPMLGSVSSVSGAGK